MEDKSKLETTINNAIFGAPELKKEERSLHLGVFRERVMIALTAAQVEEPGVYPEVLDVLSDKRAKILILRRDISLKAAEDYIKLAQQHKVAFKRVDSPGLKGDIGLIVAAADAVDFPEVAVMDRRTRLQSLGLPDFLYEATGEKICGGCWNKLATLCPKELINYQRINWMDTFLGKKCRACP